MSDHRSLEERNDSKSRVPPTPFPLSNNAGFSLANVNSLNFDGKIGPHSAMFRETLLPPSGIMQQAQASQLDPQSSWPPAQSQYPPSSAFNGILQPRQPQRPVLLSHFPLQPPTLGPADSDKSKSKSNSLSQLLKEDEDDVKQASKQVPSRSDVATNPGADSQLFSSKENSQYPIPEPSKEKRSAGLQRNAFTAHMNKMHSSRTHTDPAGGGTIELEIEDGDVEMKLNTPSDMTKRNSRSEDNGLSAIPADKLPSVRPRKRSRESSDSRDIMGLAAKRTHSETSDSVVNARVGSAAALNRASALSVGSLPKFELEAASKNPVVIERLREAKMLCDRNKFEEALEMYDDVLTNFEEFNVEALNGRGCILRSFDRTAEAAKCFEKILSKNPTNWSACHNRASLYEDAGLNRSAIRWYTEAHNAAMNRRNQLLIAVQTKKSECAQADPSKPEELDKLTRQQQAFEEALVEMENNLKTIRTHMAMSMTDLGTKMKFSGDINEACHCYEVALQWASDYAPAYYNLGVAAGELGFFADALQYYTAALERQPDYVEALCNVGVIFKNSGDIENAIECYLRALRHSNNGRSPAKCNALLNNNLAVAFTDLGTKLKDTNMEDAIRAYRKALLHNQKSADAWYNLGVAYSEIGNFEESILSYKMCVTFNPSCEHAFNNMGVIYKDCNNLGEALNNYEAALKINPKFCHALNNMSVLHTMVGSIEDGFKFARMAVEADPEYSEAHNNLGVLHRHESNILDAIRAYDRCLELNPKSMNASQNRLLAMNYTRDFTVDEVSRAHFKWGRNFYFKTHGVEPYMDWPCIEPLRIGNTQRRLVIGFISPDFFNHSVSYFIHSYLKHIDTSRTRVILYSNVVCEDDKTELFKSLVEEYVNIRHYGDAKTVAQRIRDEDRVDILVELAGHTANNCLHVMSYKPAPICVTWIGYPNTTGLPTIDYRFTDDIVDPTSQTLSVNIYDDSDSEGKCVDGEPRLGNGIQQMYSEEIVRISDCFLCYTPIDNLPRVGDLPCLKNGFVTFGSFNNLAKITDEVVALWCECMKAVGEGTRFVLKCKPLADVKVKEAFFEKFERCGIKRKNVDLMPIVADTRDHLSVYNLIDVALDTFPYAGTTTTCEAMIMGVPTVTLGQQNPHNHAHNVGVTLNSQVAALRDGGFVAWNKTDYVTGATSWCRTTEGINQMSNLRCNLRKQMLGSPLCDSVAHAEKLNHIFFQLFEKKFAPSQL